MINVNSSKIWRLAEERFGTDHKLVRQDTELTFNCPFCKKRRNKADTDHKLYVSLEHSGFYCFKCHSKGYLIKRFDRSTLEDTYKDIFDLIEGPECDYNTQDDSSEDDNTFYTKYIPIVKGSMAYEYCLSRGITDEMIDFYSIRLGIDSTFGRIVIPNQLLSGKNWTDIYSARSYLNSVTPKYWMPIGVNKKNIVFNIHNIEQNSDEMFINEGVITSVLAGYNSVALFGCHPSKNQIDQIVSKNCKNYYCTLDNDSAGREPNMELAKEISKRLPSSNVYLCLLPKGTDAADFGPDRYKEYVYENRMLYSNSVLDKVYSYVYSTR